MIDFRYHLISVIAVFLALGLGILMGSAVLDDRFVAHLERQVDRFDKRNDSLQAQIDDLETRGEAARNFALQTAPWLLEDSLQGRPVVLVTLEGTDGDAISEIRDAVELGGGSVPAEITLTEKFALRGAPDRDQLALLIDSTSAEPAELRIQAGRVLGDRLAAAAGESDVNPRPQAAANQRLTTSLRQLQDAGFVAVEAERDTAVAPAGAAFVLVAGSDEPRPFEVTRLSLSLMKAIAERGAPAMAAETSVGDWGVVRAVRDDGETSALVSTVDQAETVEGRIAVVLGLRAHVEGGSDHYGVADGATHVIPEPPSGS